MRSEHRAKLTICPSAPGNVLRHVLLVPLLYFGIAITASADEPTQSQWQGGYLGAGIGASFGMVDPKTEMNGKGSGKGVPGYYFLSADKAQIDQLLQATFSGLDISAALFAGYDWQMDPWILGVETDLSFSAFDETKSLPPTRYDTTTSSSFTTSLHVRNNVSASLRAKIGFVQNDLMLFASAGPALGAFQTTFDFRDTHKSGHSTTVESDRTVFGIAATVGAEYRLSDDWSIRGEYALSYYPGIIDGSAQFDGAGVDDFNLDSSFQRHVVRMGLAYRF